MQLIQELERTRDETLSYCSLPQRDLARTYAPGKWPVLFVLHHIFDSETILLDRICRVLSQARPVLWVFDPDEYARGLDYAHRPLELSGQVYTAARNAIIHYAVMYYEEKGHLEWVHSVTGIRTLKDEFDKVAAHNEHHLSQVRMALQSAAS